MTTKLRRLPLLLVLAALLPTLSCTNQSVGGAGAFANSFLSDALYTSLTVQIQAVAGNEPLAATAQNLEDFLNARLNKPGGITVTVDDPIPSPGKAELTVFDVLALEQEHRTAYRSGTEAVAYIIFVDADSASNEGASKILGQAYGPDTAVIFKKTVDDNAGGIGQPSQEVLETTVLLHEFGHLLGLVGIGSPTVDPSHSDTDHPPHCDVGGCLMEWAVDTTDILANLLGSGIPDLDAKCIEDLQANGGK